MIKVRLTYVTDSGEKEQALQILKEQFNVLNISKEYRGRGESKFSNVYVDIELKK